VERLWGVGPATARKLRDRGIGTVGRLAQLPEAALVSIVGRAAGRHLQAIARNRDPRRVRPGRRRRSIGSQSALAGSTRSPQALDAVVVALVDRVARRMRASGWVGRTVGLRLRFGDFSRATRSHTLPHPTSATRTILAAVRALLAAAMPTIDRRGLTLLGVTVANLGSEGAGVQLELPIDRNSGALDAALDELRERFGPDAVRRAVLLGRGPRLSADLLPGDERARGPQVL
jgi:DNA polymerase IV